MVFRIPGKDKYVPPNIIALFHRLGKLERLSHEQGESFKEYETIRKTCSDIAIEMPAGLGKTLVGGLIGEFNRLTQNWRIVYACANKQLAAQTHALLQSYGVQSVLLVGQKESFQVHDFNRYQRAAAVAVTVYSHIFNISPAFSDAHQIIFDDAHAAEYAISDFWSLTIKKEKHPEIFTALFETLGDAIASHVQDRVLHGMFDPLHDGVDIIPLALWIEKKDEIRSLLSSKVDGTDLYFSWSRIVNHLHACQIYISHDTFTIRPILPPNLKRQTAAFASSRERIYMSATVGDAGELERIFGVAHIHRISKFSVDANKISGRRLILFPEDHFSKDQLWEVLAETIRMQSRALILCPSYPVLQHVLNKLKEHIPDYSVFLSKDIEESMEPFVSSQKGVLLLAGRYEGIDLKDDQCRLQIIYELPVAIGTSEQFLQARLRVKELLRTMLATRILQGLGRCTRGHKDYASVLFVGKRVGEYMYKDEFLGMLPAEVDAEISFGFEQIEQIRDLSTWKQALQIFFDQGEEWSEIEGHIQTLTDEKNKARIREVIFNESLRLSAADELSYLYSIWEGEFEKAHQSADQVLKHFGRQETLKGYRAWWNYLIASVGVLQGEKEKAREYHQKAVNAADYKLWLDKRVFNERQIGEDENFPELVEYQLNTMLAVLESYGDRSNRFDKHWATMVDGLSSPIAETYEPALCTLGQFLGFESDRPKGKGTPDGVWLSLSCGIVFEAKTNVEKPEGAISLDDIRQTGYHENYVRKNYPVSDSITITTVMICPKQYVEKYAEHTTEGIFLLEPKFILELANVLEPCLRVALQKLKYAGYEDARSTLGQLIIEHSLTIQTIVENMQQVELVDVVK
ncbi:RAD3-like DEAD/DEAH box helicase [Paenibacillus cellulosilyticus]|uniref:RAD3-like DEAD/DEAH box helicase n=1 Tax=Paenibacillus cellulosilyticus TaxID=375489 RepID=A0A2V2YWB8_9BACL|nr:helicase C-terminal domain-containing protein [Paenibacillus cellulosilyticus]PWW01234.1 RAD3-like DEAD/DEAH box helicase [Paenibacillus cellulosilyticus]QKS46812.1 hypothetical protein HUB94_20225 [Paenibacillus cellulosilyticus]